MSALASRVLVLNKSWVAFDIWSLEHAITKLFKTSVDGTPKAKIVNIDDFSLYGWDEWAALKLEEGDKLIRSTSRGFKVPEVIVLTGYNKYPKPRLNFSRKSLYKLYKQKCFVPDTLISMANGDFKFIKDIKIGDRILNHKGNSEIVEYVNSRHIDEEISSIKHVGNGDSLNCTLEHPILVNSNYIKHKKDWETTESFKKAEQLAVSDYLFELNMKNMFCVETKEVDISEIIDLGIGREEIIVGQSKIYHKRGKKEINRFLTLGNEFGRLVGYFLAEGNTSVNELSFCFHIDEKEYVEDVKNLLQKLFGVNCRVKIDEETSTAVVFCNSIILYRLFRKLLYKNKIKRIASKNYSKTFFDGLLCGIIRGDGTFEKTIFRCVLMLGNTNKKLVKDIYIISQICGIYPTLSKTGTRIDGRTYKSVIYQSNEYNKILKIVDLDFPTYDKNSKIDRFFTDKNIISKIKSIKTFHYEGLVFNLQVSGEHTYVANFVCVHNCQFCGKRFTTDELTIDHVIPKSQGGKTTWENCVLCCIACNAYKANRTPYEARMKLLCGKPQKPTSKLFDVGKIRCKSWENFVSEIYWNVDIGED